jgi:hypothetical protein
MRRIQDMARETRRQLPAKMAGAKLRLRGLEEYYDASIETAEAILARLRRKAASTRHAGTRAAR